MKEGNLLIVHASQLVTCSGHTARRGAEMSDLGIIEDGAVLIRDGRIAQVGTTSDVCRSLNTADYEVIDATGKALLPGFVDSHTHLVFGGFREEEFSWRLKGDSYMSIMERGGGIANTVKATRRSSYDELLSTATDRLNEMFRMGVTTVEAKSGYGLDSDTELTQLRLQVELNRRHPMDVVSTYLGAHATPEEFAGRSDDYIDFIIQEMFPLISREGIATFCDVFCEKGVFSLEQSERLLLAARGWNFKLKLHADEIVPFGGAELAAKLHAVSADHLLQASDRGIRCMADSGVVATLLPLTAFSLNEPYARGRAMIDAGCAVALASDLNPGSCFSSSIPMIFALACIQMKLTAEEAVTALTINGAAALGLADETGSIDVGKRADLVLLKYPSYKFLPYHVGMNIVESTIKNGRLYVH
ncbi:MAG: imidazolonepropionase [Tannerellaceae bacterium]